MCMCYATIPTTTNAKRTPQTAIEYDAPVMAIRKGRAEELYDVREFPCGMDGRAFELVKDRTADVYCVFVSRNGQDDHCDCIGHLQHGVCKHTDSLRHLIETGKLEHPMAGSPPVPVTPDDDLLVAPF